MCQKRLVKLKLIDFISTIKVSEEAEGYCGELNFPQSLEVFEGHFTEYPVLPGFSLIEISQRILASTFGLKIDSYQMKRSKFTSLMGPSIDYKFRLIKTGEFNFRIIWTESRGERAALLNFIFKDC